MGITYMRCKVILIVWIFFYNNNANNNACSRNRPHGSLAHDALRSGVAPNRRMRDFAANGGRADQSRGSPLQEGGAVTRSPSNESRPRMSEPRPRRRRRNGGQIIAPRLLERVRLGLRQLERVVWLSDRSLDAGLISSRRWRWSGSRIDLLTLV